ncbi:ImmA/IrrE family metallo-endopeptidase [Thiohalobacter thiocyanaticus]|uniref:ImmA/IrrE family metallo-endopeptidase n=1 Tax=Thiohalobacter thiocyanaticus TaxID=585455 RepID=A0A426QJH3_9GAMM|nr:ImmA/IrrE family metallo-endopeptidase [Thiohalobacter thiocyanaticus]RRQ21909.1 ImmA/IrrE family metallo-endopeptidase [Thiohalobacter thiocyanaticus]
MAKTAEATINPDILVWARETVGFSIDDLADKIKVNPEKIQAWESGQARPSIAKLKQISDKLKRPLAVFYLPYPPEDMRPPRDFRGLIEGHAGFYSNRLHVELRLAEARREDALNLLAELEEQPSEFDFQASIDQDPELVAESLTRYIGVEPETIAQCSDIYEARKLWKSSIENRGVLVFQANGVPVSEMRGFCLGVRPLPVVVVNSKDSPQAQIFSLLHELTHIALRQDGLCDFDEELPRDGESQRIEIFCNYVAGAAIVPAKALLSHEIVLGQDNYESWSNHELKSISRTFHCSREVVLRRLLIHDLTTRDFYSKMRESFVQEYKDFEENKKANSFPVAQFRKVINRNGYYFSRLVLDSYTREVITGSELSRLLKVKLKHLPDIRHALQG